MKKALIILNLLLYVAPTVVWSGPVEEAVAKQSFEDFKVIYTKSDVTKDELKDALTLILKSSELSPTNYKYAFSAAATYEGLGKYDKAIEWYRKAADIAITDEQRLNAEAAASDSRFMLVSLRNRNETRPGHEISVSMILKGINYEPDLGEGQDLPTMFPPDLDPHDHNNYLESRFRQSQPFKNRDFLIFSLDSQKTAQQHYEQGVKDFYKYFQNRIFDDTKHKPIILFLSDDPVRLIELINELYPNLRFRSNHPFLGYFNKRDNVIFATVLGGYGTLLHEMIHTLIHADYPKAPGWLAEAFATIYERTLWKNNRLIPLPNWRMDRMDLEDVAPLNIYKKYKGDIELGFLDLAKLRLLYIYLDELDQLQAFYRAVKASNGNESASQTAIKLGVEEAAWRDFAENSIIDYQIDLAKERGRSVNPAETRFIQRALNVLLGAGLKEDGIWGNTTEAKLKAFQSSQGLKPDGIYGRNTRATLHRLFAEKAIE